MSQDTNPSSNPSVALSFNRRTIAVLLAAIVGLTTVFLIMTGGSGGTIAQAATVDVKLSSLTDHECDETEWHFVITQLDSADDAPEFITVTWTGDVTAEVRLEKVTGRTAHYTTTLHLDLAVTGATADLPDDWSGQFNLSHGPCGGPSPTSPPTTTTASP